MFASMMINNGDVKGGIARRKMWELAFLINARNSYQEWCLKVWWSQMEDVKAGIARRKMWELFKSFVTVWTNDEVLHVCKYYD